MPPELIKWVTKQPSDVLSPFAPLRDIVALPYLLPTMNMHQHVYLMDILRKEVTRNLSSLQPAIFRDMKVSADKLLGTDAENWRSVPLYAAVQEVLFESSNRMFVGEPLCRNAIFLRSAAVFANVIGAGAVFVGEYLPLVLKPVFGYALAPPIYLAQAVAFRYLVPEIKRRMANIRQQRSHPEFEWDQPKDMLMWIVIAAMDRHDPKAEQPEIIAQGLLFLVSLSKGVSVESALTTAAKIRCWLEPKH